MYIIRSSPPPHSLTLLLPILDKMQFSVTFFATVFALAASTVAAPTPAIDTSGLGASIAGPITEFGNTMGALAPVAVDFVQDELVEPALGLPGTLIDFIVGGLAGLIPVGPPA
ncbi:hypothetical protein HGRIS_014047 [Hohenbuehelia grisea]|uniref:Uncharacterized protein n=1 Tax=Hohenbuehelia grisea TaxID=104357 RepID=A0ABR3JT55_9AGAR